VAVILRSQIHESQVTVVAKSKLSIQKSRLILHSRLLPFETHLYLLCTAFSVYKYFYEFLKLMVCIFSGIVTSQNSSRPVTYDSIFVNGITLAIMPRCWNYATVTLTFNCLCSCFLSYMGLNKHKVEWECKIIIPYTYVYVWAFSQIQHNHSLRLPLRTVRPIYNTGVPLPSRCCILYIFSATISTEYFKHAAHSPFFSSKCRLFHNATFFGLYIIHILHRECAKI
jgi:hypothetical protein